MYERKELENVLVTLKFKKKPVPQIRFKMNGTYKLVVFHK